MILCTVHDYICHSLPQDITQQSSNSLLGCSIWNHPPLNHHNFNKGIKLKGVGIWSRLLAVN